jgi:hypothetical protein
MQPLKNFSVFYGTWRFITVFTIALHWFLSWARSVVHAIQSQTLKSILILPTQPPTYVLAFLVAYFLLTSYQYRIRIYVLPNSCYMSCPSHSILEEEYKVWSSTSCNFPQPPVSSSLSVQISSSAPCSQTLSTLIAQCQRPSFTRIQNHRKNYTFEYSTFYVFRQL